MIDFKFDLQRHGGVTKFLGGLVGGLLGNKSNQGNTTVVSKEADPIAQPASQAPAPTPVSDSTSTSATEALKKRAKGKANLTISSGSSSGGTGLNV